MPPVWFTCECDSFKLPTYCTYKSEKYIKAAMNYIFIVTIDQMTMCNVTAVAFECQSHKRECSTESEVPLCCTVCLVPLSSMFWFSGYATLLFWTKCYVFNSTKMAKCNIKYMVSIIIPRYTLNLMPPLLPSGKKCVIAALNYICMCTNPHATHFSMLYMPKHSSYITLTSPPTAVVLCGK